MEISEVIIPLGVEAKLIRKHDVQAYEVEEVFDGEPHIRFLERGKVRNEHLYAAMGRTESGRLLVVFFLRKRKGKVLVISCRDMDRREKRHYEQVSKQN